MATNKTSSAIRCFITSTLLSTAFFFAIKHYIEFIEQVAGSYNIVMLFGMPLRDFLLIVLLFVAGILAFLTFLVKSVKCKKPKTIYPFYLVLMGILWIILPYLSVYTISRFTGDLILQTVSSIAIIANAVFMMVSVCCGIIAIIDFIHGIIDSEIKESSADSVAMLLAGIPTGYGLILLLTGLLTSVLGISGIVTLIGILNLAVGLITIVFKKSQ